MDQEFKLPRSVLILYTKHSHKVVAHNLDLDLVCVGADQQEAETKIFLSTKSYVEYGLSNNLSDQILRPAPKKFWDKIWNSKISERAGEILINQEKIATLSASHESQEASVTA